MAKQQPESVRTGTHRKFKYKELRPNPLNPRRLFDKEPLQVLEKSIRENGILVPLTVYQERTGQYYILDGERRWRCAEKISTDPVHPKSVPIPANVVDPPSKVANILWMFNIHNLREQWELMPAALSLKIVMEELKETDEANLAKLTYMSEPNVRRCKVLLSYPEKYQRMMLAVNQNERVKANFFIELHPILDLYEKLPQLNAHNGELGQVLFAPLGRIGESGPDIARRFRNANNLSSRQSQFVELPGLSDAVFKASEPIVVFLDDFVGTGKQVSDAWRDVLSSIVPEFVPMYLLVIAAYAAGMRRVEGESPIKVLHVHLLGGRDQLLSSAHQSLSNSEKTAVKNYCVKAGNQPLGFGDLGALVSFAYGTPNNTISVIRGSEKQRPWKGLLPRWEDLR